MLSRIKQTVILSALSAVVFLGMGVCESTLFAQGDGGVPVGGDTGQQAAQNLGNDRTATTSQGEGVGELGTAIELDTTLEPIDDTRNQGFVGVTASRIQDYGFVGRRIDRPAVSRRGICSRRSE